MHFTEGSTIYVPRSTTLCGVSGDHAHPEPGDGSEFGVKQSACCRMQRPVEPDGTLDRRLRERYPRILASSNCASTMSETSRSCAAERFDGRSCSSRPVQSWPEDPTGHLRLCVRSTRGRTPIATWNLTRFLDLNRPENQTGAYQGATPHGCLRRGGTATSGPKA